MKNSFYRNLLLGLILIVAASFQVAEGVLPTSLKVTVLDELGNPVQGAHVVLFSTKSDYKAEINSVVPLDSTDEKGRVSFKGLEPMQYYVHATYEDKSNIGAGVLTSLLIEGKSNKVNTIIE